MHIQELIAEARDRCAHLEDSDDWHDTIEDTISELAESPTQADDAIVQMNTQLFRAAGLI